MLEKDKKELKKLHLIYNKVIANLRLAMNNSKTSRSISKAVNELHEMNKDNDIDFDNEIIALSKSSTNLKQVTLQIVQKFQIYLRNHAEPDTKRALKVTQHDLTPKDYTKNYNPNHLYRAYLESYFYFVPCGDVTTFRTDLAHGNYFNFKGDLKTIKSNREDLMHSSHNGNIKKFMGKTERESVKRHNL